MTEFNLISFAEMPVRTQMRECVPDRCSRRSLNGEHHRAYDHTAMALVVEETRVGTFRINVVSDFYAKKFRLPVVRRRCDATTCGQCVLISRIHARIFK